MNRFIKLAVVAFALAAVVVAGRVSFAATWDFGSTTLSTGSSGTFVSNLQTALNTCASANLTVDGQFGSHTMAAVEAFQSAHSLSVDGKVGPLTGAALNVCGSMTSMGGTGSCPVGYTCMPVNVPPAACPVGYTCTANPGTVPTNTSNLPGSINSLTYVAGYGSTQVGVGVTNQKVGGVLISTGPGSNLTLNAVSVSLLNNPAKTGTYLLSKYLQNVSVWLNGTEVGSADISAFSLNNSVYSATIPLSGATIQASTNSNYLYIAVSALPVIDSANLGTAANQFAVSLASIRYTDGTGAALQYQSSGVFGEGSSLSSSTNFAALNTSFSFASAASASSIKLTVTQDLNDSTNRVLIASSSSNTNGNTFGIVDMQAQGSAILLSRLPVTLSVGGGATTTSDVVNTLRLYDANGNQLDSENVVSNPSSTSQTVTFQLSNAGAGTTCITGVCGVQIPSGGTSVFTIKGDVNEVGNVSFSAGSYAEVDITPTNVGNIQAFDQNTNQLSGTSVLTGSVTGHQNFFYVNGIQVSANGTPTNQYSGASGTQAHGTFTMTIPFSVTAFGSTAYIPSTTTVATSATAAANIQYCLDNGACFVPGGTSTTGTTGGVIAYVGSSGLTPDTNHNYVVQTGQSQSFDLIITFQPGNTSGSVSYRGSLLNVNWNNSDSASLFNTFTSGLNTNSFKTPYLSGN